MPVIYEVIYIPWINNQEGKPWLYSGSDWNNNPKYLGSPCSKQIPDWSDGKTIKDWWKYETTHYPDRFIKRILLELTKTESLTNSLLREIESDLQKIENHAEDSRYFNRTNRMGGYFPKGSKKFKPSWNKGLTKKDPRVKNNIEKMKVKRQNQNMGRWITDGEHDKKWYEEHIPRGWSIGRTNSPLRALKGEFHSQYGSFWINNGIENKKLQKGANIPDGFIKGRINVRKNNRIVK